MDARQHASLTPTERRILLLVHHSRKSEAIAALAGMSRHTVDQHIKSARGKLGNVGRYVAADSLRAFEQHPHPYPHPQGSVSTGMANFPQSSASVELPDRQLEIAYGANMAASEGIKSTGQPGKADHLEQWLQERTILSRIVLVLAATFLLLLLIITAPLLAEQMGKIGLLLYQ